MARRTRASFAAEVRKASAASVKDGASLQRTMDMAFKRLGEEARGVIVGVLAGCFSQLQNDTPYDTGRAQAGWLMTGDGSAVGFTPGKKEASYSPTEPDEGSLVKSDLIYVVNNVEYVLFLEAGWSKRQPGGFIARFLADARRRLTEACAAMSAAR